MLNARRLAPIAVLASVLITPAGASTARAAAPEWGDPVQAATDAVPTTAEAAVSHAVNTLDRVLNVTFTDGDGRPVTLEGELAEGPVVLIFYRGGWCGYCVGQLKEFESAGSATSSAAGGRIIAVSTELPRVRRQNPREEQDSAIRGSQRPRTPLRQPGVSASRGANERYGKIGVMAKYKGNEKGEIPLGVTYVIDAQTASIRWAFIDRTTTPKRATPDQHRSRR
jgi:thiol-disulfide isomerase/thioredoxin